MPKDPVRTGLNAEAELRLPAIRQSGLNYLFFQLSLQPFRHTKPGDKQDQAHNQEQEEQKLRNSRCRRGNTREAKDRRDQRNYQKYNCPTQHNNSPLPLAIRVSS